MRDRRSGLVLGGGLILIGLYLLARTMGVPLPGWNAAWPLLLLAGGLSSLVQALGQDPRDSGGVWFGITAILSSAIFLYITLGRGEWSDMRTLWPLFPAAAAVGWLAAWLVNPREVSSLVMAAIAGAGAVLGYAFSSGRLSADFGRQLASWWPLILVVLGLGYIVQYLVQKR
ncbi:MAG: hypothetical protein R6X16_15450 [Anaerolineae bacterium]